MARTKLWYMTSKYGNFCCSDVLDARQAQSDSESSKQCGECLCGGLIFPFSPLLVLCDLISYPIRGLVNYCKNKK
jgi:hypothetical protein